MSTTEQPARPSLRWTGSDEFSELSDRQEADPLPLPGITVPKRVVLVRHGESTWNAEGRIQGSSNTSVLNEKGHKQAEATREMLSGWNFAALYHSPLQRAKRTAEIIWTGRTMQPVQLPALREIDLYSFQGLLKHEGKALFGDAYTAWQQSPASFRLDGHAPVRELWYRASLAWQTILQAEAGNGDILVVAHNAVNQALIATAIGLPPTAFRLLVQSNAAVSVLDFQPAPGGGTPHARLACLNQSASGPKKASFKAIKGAPLSLLLVPHPGPSASEPHAAAAARVVSTQFQVDAAIHTGHPAAEQLAGQLAQDCTASAGRECQTRQLADMPSDDASANTQKVSLRAVALWQQLLQMAGASGAQTLALVADPEVTAAMLCVCLGLSDSVPSVFQLTPYGISVLAVAGAELAADDWSGDTLDLRACEVACINHAAHLQ